MRPTSRPVVGVVFGGSSEEHPVSVKSASEVAKHIDTDRFDPLYLGITPSGAWKLAEAPGRNWASGGRPAVLSPDRAVHGLVVLDGQRHETLRLDVVLPVLHGTHGEDGAIQGLLDLAGIPYVGCDIQSSALCMDKALAYTVVRAAGIATPKFRVLRPDETADFDAHPLPAFVKPARSGSSFGVTKVSRHDDFPAAIAAAREYDGKVLIEEAVIGLEVGCALLGSGVELFVGELDQVSLSDGLFRIHQEANPEAGSENATITVPADLPAETRRVVIERARTIYQALGCSGLARVDMFITDNEEVVLNEVNTLPGLTSYSRYPKMMAAAGLTLTDVIDRLVSLALNGDRR